MTRTTFKAGLAVICLWAFSGTANAALISGFSLLPNPDIFADFITVDYDGAGGLFIDGFAETLDTGSSAEMITGGTFTVSADVDGSGNLISGTLSIGGTIAALGFNSGTLLTGNLTDFGFQDGGGDPLQFLFDVTGGDAAALYGSMGGINLGFSGFTGDWGSPFTNGGNGLADIRGVPLPAAIWLLGAGLLSIAGTRRRTGR